MRAGPNLFLRTDGRWEARYQKGRDARGKIIYGFVYGKSQEEAERKRAEALRGMPPDPGAEKSILASRNPYIRIPVIETPSGNAKNEEKTERTKFLYDKLTEPLEDGLCAELDKVLAQSDAPYAAAFYLSLHMGIAISECAALRYADIDLQNAELHINAAVGPGMKRTVLTDTWKRCLPIPAAVLEFLKTRPSDGRTEQDFVFTGSDEPAAHAKTVMACFRHIIKGSERLKGVSPAALRCTFIKRCLEAGLNIETVTALTGVEKSRLYKSFGMYIHADLSAIHRIEAGSRRTAHRQLNLLILGAGSHGQNVRETAEKLGVFQEIRFLDDKRQGGDIIGRCGECYRFLEEFPCAFVAIGNNETRRRFSDLLRGYGFMLPTLIHPDATVSQNSVIGEGSVIFAQATVNTSEIGDCCIVASNALVNFGADVGSFSHLDCGAIVLKNTAVPENTMVNSGVIFRAENF